MRIALLPVGATEKHGPHLPLDTDTRLAVGLARRVAEAIGAQHAVEVAAPFTETACAFAADFAGTLNHAPEAEREGLRARIEGVLAGGAQRVVLVNLHFDPAHMQALRTAVGDVEAKDPGRVVFPDFTRRAAAQRIGGEFATGACHAGEFETSLLLALEPGRVAASYQALPPREVDLAHAIREGKRSFRELGLDEAYCGHPATATPEEGERLLGVLAAIVLEAVLPGAPRAIHRGEP